MTFPASHISPPEPERNKEAASLIRQVGDELNFRLRQLHEQLLEQVPDVDRIACALYEPSDDMLKTFVLSTRQGEAIKGYEFRHAPIKEIGIYRLSFLRLIKASRFQQESSAQP